MGEPICAPLRAPSCLFSSFSLRESEVGAGLSWGISSDVRVRADRPRIDRHANCQIRRLARKEAGKVEL